MRIYLLSCERHMRKPCPYERRMGSHYLYDERLMGPYARRMVTPCSYARRMGRLKSTSERERRSRSAKIPAAVSLRPAPGPCSTIGLSE